MKKGFIVCLGVLMLNLWLPLPIKAIIMTPSDTIYYFIKVDTSAVHVGYLRVDSMDTNLTLVDSVKGDYALWKFKRRSASIPDYYIINKKTGDTIAFDVPTTDTRAIIHDGGAINVWYALFAVNTNDPELLLSYNAGFEYYLTYDGEVKISPEASTSLKPIRFQLERPKFDPIPGEFYRIKVDTLPGDYLGYLSADTLTATLDSIRIDTARTDLTLWQFDLDTLINDTAIYKITNKVTGVMLAFDVPNNDTIAYVKNTGLLNLWLTPLYTEENRIAQLMARDTTTKTDYFLGLDEDTVVWFVNDTTDIAKLSFYIEDEILPPPPPQYLFDSTKVYRMKYLNGQNVGPHNRNKYLGVDAVGIPIWLDSVYAHIPDGQFVVNKANTSSLLNRTQTENLTDSIFYALDISNNRIPDTYVYREDTVEITEINYGSFDKTDPHLGYKYVHPSSLSTYCHYFVYSSPDSLEGRILSSDWTVKLLELNDTAMYLLEEVSLSLGAPEVGGIEQLRKYQYRLHSLSDTSLYLSGHSPSEMTNVKTDAALYYLKESENPKEYYLLLYKPDIHKLIVDSVSKQLIHAPKDTLAFSLFRIEETIRRAYEDPDPYTYLTQLPDNKGRGFYELRITNPQPPGQMTWLSKNFYDYPVLAREGESMLRAGSYTPYDLQLWVDTARGTGFQPDKPYFYIVKDVDTTDSYKIQGYFLHVIDSPLLAPNNDYIVEVNGKTYNRLNFVNATRVTANDMQLISNARIINGLTLNEYRFYFQETDEKDATGKPVGYYLVTEAGYGDGHRSNERGYLSFKTVDTLYVGPRDGALKIQFTGSTVANVIIPPAAPPLEEISREITIIGQAGRIDIHNAAGQPAYVYNMLGRLIVQQTLASDNETIPATRGIHIVKAGPITRKVIVQ